VRVIWRPRAETDLSDLFEYLLERNPTAALRILETIRRQVALLADQPHLGRPGRVADIRELVIPRTPYLVAYTVDRAHDTVFLLRVLNGARRWPDDLA